MKRRGIIACGLFACMTMAFMPLGCGSRIEYPPLKGRPVSEGPHAPNETIARLRECVEEYGGDLGGRGFEFHYNVKVDEEGRPVDVKSDVPHADFNGCTRAALRAMQTPPELLRTWMSQPLARGEGQTNGARGFVGNVVVIVGVTIALAPIIIEAAGVTILFTITLALAEEVVEAIQRRPRWQNECDKRRTECLGTPVQSEPGDLKGRSLCMWCHSECMKNEGEWPARVERDGTYSSCQYWLPNWQR